MGFHCSVEGDEPSGEIYDERQYVSSAAHVWQLGDHLLVFSAGVGNHLLSEFVAVLRGDLAPDHFEDHVKLPEESRPPLGVEIASHPFFPFHSCARVFVKSLVKIYIYI